MITQENDLEGPAIANDFAFMSMMMTAVNFQASKHSKEQFLQFASGVWEAMEKRELTHES